jgi:hypothetical protein
MQGVRHGLQDAGIQNVEAARERPCNDTLRYEIRSPAAQKEGGVKKKVAFTDFTVTRNASVNWKRWMSKGTDLVKVV